MTSVWFDWVNEGRVFRSLLLAACIGVVLASSSNAAAQISREQAIRHPPRSSSGRGSASPSNDIKPTAVPAAAPAAGQRGRRPRYATVCGNPNVPCRTEVTFQPHDLPFRLAQNAVIWESELFYAVMLKSVPAIDYNCDLFIPESDRLSAQALFPDHKVFASRCVEPGELFYTNTRANNRIMAVYAGKTLAEANRVLAAVKATGKFPGANVRRMRAGFNGT